MKDKITGMDSDSVVHVAAYKDSFRLSSLKP